jgi:hypothetical protein
MLLSVTHPDFVHNLDRRGALKHDPRGLCTMPGSENLRLPVVRRSREKYMKVLENAGFKFQDFDILADDRVLKDSPGLKDARSIPLGLVFRCSQK